MKYLILISLVAVTLLYKPAEAQTCPGGTGSCNCQLNNVESLRALIQSEVQAEVETEVETEVAASLASTPGNVRIGNIQAVGKNIFKTSKKF